MELKRNRLTKVQPKTPKNQTDEPSSQHTVHFITVETITTLIHKPCLIMTGEILVKKMADKELASAAILRNRVNMDFFFEPVFQLVLFHFDIIARLQVYPETFRETKE